MPRGPVYVQIDEDQAVLNELDSLKQRLLKAKELLHELYDIRTAENKSIHDVQEYTREIHARVRRIQSEELA